MFSQLKLETKPFGLDIKNHKDKDKRINFKNIDALTFFIKNNKTFDLILIKQTIHLLKIINIRKLLILCKKKLNPKGKIIILTLSPYQNQIPTFSLMHRKLKISLTRDKKIINLISKLYPRRIIKKFTFNVKISKKKYLKMIKNRYISILLKLSSKEILDGMSEIDIKYKNVLKFKDKLQCVIIKK